MGKFIPTKCCIYLDQFAVSNLSEEEGWKDILKILKTGISSQRIFIPYSTEHLIESSLKDPINAQKTDKLFYSLTNGVGLDVEHRINSRYLINAIRNRPISFSTYCKTYPSSIFENESELIHFQALKNMFNKMSSESTSLVNDLRSIRRPVQSQNFNRLSESVNFLSSHYQEELEHRLKKYSKYGFFDRKTINFSMISIPHWADSIMDELIYVFKLTQKEAKKGYLFLVKNGVKKTIPPLYVRTSLEAIIALKQQKETSNDHIDIMRLCTAIPFSDIILTDKSKAFDIKTLKLDIEFNFDVYSGSRKDIILFKDRISEIVEYKN